MFLPLSFHERLFKGKSSLNTTAECNFLHMTNLHASHKDLQEEVIGDMNSLYYPVLASNKHSQ